MKKQSTPLPRPLVILSLLAGMALTTACGGGGGGDAQQQGGQGGGNQPTDAVWDQFAGRFRGPVVDFATRLGLDEDAAQDVAQDALLTFARAYRDGRYDRERGRLRSWLFGIAAREAMRRRREEHRTARQAPRVEGRTTLISSLPDDADVEALWEDAWTRHALRVGLEQVRREMAPSTFGAFEQFAINGVPAARVAETLGMTPNAVFLAKRRVLRRLEEVCAEIEGDS